MARVARGAGVARVARGAGVARTEMNPDGALLSPRGARRQLCVSHAVSARAGAFALQGFASRVRAPSGCAGLDASVRGRSVHPTVGHDRGKSQRFAISHEQQAIKAALSGLRQLPETATS